MEKLKVAMIGSWSSVAGFKAVGVETRAVASPEEGPAAWESLAGERYAVVLVTEPVYEVLVKEVPDLLAREELPVVLAIPAVEGATGAGRAGIRKRIEKALGSAMEG